MSGIIENRPWGNFHQFCHNEKCTVKHLNVDVDKRLSLQYHYHRDEFWKVIKGEGSVVIGNDVIHAKEGDEFYIPRKVLHRIMTDKNSSLMILELSYGHFDEKDIVRIEDDFGRVADATLFNEADADNGQYLVNKLINSDNELDMANNSPVDLINSVSEKLFNK